MSHNEFGASCDSYIGPDWHKAELGLLGSYHPEPNPYFYGVTVVKDTNGRLASLVAASPAPTAVLTREAARTEIEKLLYEIGSITMGNIRGSYYHQMHNLCEYATSAYSLLAQLRGHEGYAVRFVERFLNEDELALLYAAWPQAPEREAIRRAARGLLEWIRYVWAQVEQTLGEELGIALDTAAFCRRLIVFTTGIWQRHMSAEPSCAHVPPNRACSRRRYTALDHRYFESCIRSVARLAD